MSLRRRLDSAPLYPCQCPFVLSYSDLVVTRTAWSVEHLADDREARLAFGRAEPIHFAKAEGTLAGSRDREKGGFAWIMDSHQCLSYRRADEGYNVDKSLTFISSHQRRRFSGVTPGPNVVVRVNGCRVASRKPVDRGDATSRSIHPLVIPGHPGPTSSFPRTSNN